MPGGGFRVPHPGGHGPIGNEPHHQTGLLAMAFTSHLKNLRINGKPRTEYSVEYTPTEGELAVEVGPDRTRETRILIFSAPEAKLPATTPITFRLTEVDKGESAAAGDFFKAPGK